MMRLNIFDAQRHHRNLKWTEIKRVINIKHENGKIKRCRLAIILKGNLLINIIKLDR